jgi:chemotaxis protein MotA
MAVVGLLIVIASVLGGFALSGGHFAILFQPNEFIVIGGAALGALIVSAPGNLRSKVFGVVGGAFKSTMPTKPEYLELLTCQFEVFTFMRKNGAVALDEHVNDPEKSSIFKKYPSVLKRHHELEFLLDALKQIVNGTASAEELDMLLENEIETHHDELAVSIGLLKVTGDALPGLGIVAAVLGIVITMGHLDGGPEAIGHHVAAALVGTFLGILLCYGIVAPLATNFEMQQGGTAKYYACMRAGVVAALKGSAPAVAVEFARKAVYSADRPSASEMEEACKKAKSAA